MTIFWLTLTIVYLCGYFARTYSSNAAIENGNFQQKPNKIFAFIPVAVLILVSGLRMPQGTGRIGDTGSYTFNFIRYAPDNMTEAFENFRLFSGDSGFIIFQSFIKEFISTEPQIFLFICALLTNLFIFIIIYRYSVIFELSLFLYITTGCYLVSMNGVRQYLVSAILFLSIKLIESGKWLPYFIIVVLVSTVHISALLFIPVYFFVRLKPWSPLIGITLLTAVVVLLLFNQVGTVLLSFLEETKYGQYEEYILTEGGGANIIRVIVAAIPMVLAYLSRKQIEEAKDNFVNILINFSVLNVVFYILAIQNWIFARMCIYFGLYGLLLLPWLIKRIYDEKTSCIIYSSCLLLYCIYYYYEMVATLNINYISDFIGF